MRPPGLGPGRTMRDLEDVRPDPALDPGEVGAPADQLAVGDVRCERPQASRTIASSRLVLPAAFGPTTSCGPGPNVASSVA